MVSQTGNGLRLNDAIGARGSGDGADAGAARREWQQKFGCREMMMLR